jgi:hypothetical protein
MRWPAAFDRHGITDPRGTRPYNTTSPLGLWVISEPVRCYLGAVGNIKKTMEPRRNEQFCSQADRVERHYMYG